MSSSATSPLLAAHDLTVVLPGDAGDVRVLDSVSFALTEHETVDVVGPSGSGKTTLLRALARLLPSVAGAIELRGEDGRSMPGPQWRSKVALLPQKPAIVPGSIRENLLLPFHLKVRTGAPAPNDARLRRVLDELGLVDIALDRDAARLSVGQQARVALSRVLLTEPAVLLLDEADAALDDASSAALREVASRFAEGGGGVVRVRHRGDDGLAARRLKLEGGHLAEVAL